MSQPGSKIVKDGVAVVQGTPAEPLVSATLVLKLWSVQGPKQKRTLASLYMVRPGRDGYVVKELIPETEQSPQAALDKAVAIAQRGDVTTIYLNADLAKLPPLVRAAHG